MRIYPKMYLSNVKEITIEFLKKYELEALILDIDNTLIDYNKNLAQDIIEWAEVLKKEGIKLYILSNTNKKEKVSMVAQKLEIPYKMFAKKPAKKGFIEIQKELKIENKKIGVVGDQIFTDVIGANRCDMFSILVDPVDKKDFWYTAWKRPIEDKLKKKLVKR